MITIWKYPVGIDGAVEVPFGAKIRKVALQDDRLTLWCEVSTDTFLTELLQITAYATGENIRYPQQQKYLDTVFTRGLVWHIYVDKERATPTKRAATMEELRESHA